MLTSPFRRVAALLNQNIRRGIYGALAALVCVLALPSAASALSFERVQGLPRSCESSSGVQASDGSLWTTCSQKAKSGGGLMRISPSGKVTGPFTPPVELYDTERLPKPTWNISGMVPGRSGSVWFTSGYGLVCNVSAMGHMACVRTASSLKHPTETLTAGITEGSYGNMWMLEEVQAKSGPSYASIVRLTPGLQMTEFSLPEGWSILPGLVLGSNGDLWFGRDLKHVGLEGVAYITPSGEIMSFPLTPEAVTSAVPELALPSGPVYFVAGDDSEHVDRVMPDGSQSVIVSLHTILDVIPGAEESAWVLGQSLKAGLGYHYYKPGVIDHIAASGAVTSFPLSGRFVIDDLQLGPDGLLWGITHGDTEKVLRLVSIGSSGKIVTHASFHGGSGTFPEGLVASPTSLWLFTSDPKRGNNGGTELERVTGIG
jgi:streptogramin lyase